MMNFEEIKKYWETRAAGDSSAQSTTQDFYLREIEYRVLSERIPRYAPRAVADVGCGDGRTTARLAASNSGIEFTGLDYAASMIDNARQAHEAAGLSNISFRQADICAGLDQSYDLIYTTRCLINLPSWQMQQAALDHMHRALRPGGMYLMVENFIEGQAAFNEVRRLFALPEIAVRAHNFFFERPRLVSYLAGRFTIDEEINISSQYYLVSRVIYSKICQERGTAPDYFDDHHRFAAGLPLAGECGPVRLLCLKKC